MIFVTSMKQWTTTSVHFLCWRNEVASGAQNVNIKNYDFTQSPTKSKEPFVYGGSSWRVVYTYVRESIHTTFGEVKKARLPTTQQHNTQAQEQK